MRVALGLSPQTSAKRGSQSHWGERWQAECGPDPEGVGESEEEARGASTETVGEDGLCVRRSPAQHPDDGCFPRSRWVERGYLLFSVWFWVRLG